MFDLGFSELVVIALVALVVIGPERLPKVARTVGLLLGRLQRYVSDVKAEINREMQLEELKKLQQEVHDSARELEQGVRREMSEVEGAVAKTSASVTEAVAAAQDGNPAAGSAPVGEAAAVAEANSAQLELGLDPQSTKHADERGSKA